MTKILHITTWYPNELDPQLGIFIQKHIHIGHDFAENVVIALIASDEIREPKLRTHQKGNIIEIIGYYPARKGKSWSNFKYQNHMLTKIFQHFLTLDFKPDFVHCHVADKSLKIANKFFKGTPTLLSEHWSGYLDGRYDQLSSRVKRKRLQLTNHCIKVNCVSDHLKAAMVKSGITVPINVIPNIIEANKTKESFNDDLRFLVVADLVDHVKNISGIINAFTIFNKENTETSLTIIGDGEDRKSLHQLASKCEAITFLGRYNNEEVLNELPEYDCLIVNSYKETFSMITAEALLSGVPVIATKCGGPEQFVIDNENGFLVDVNDEKDLLRQFFTFKSNISKLDSKSIKNSVLAKLNSNDIKEKIRQLYV